MEKFDFQSHFQHQKLTKTNFYKSIFLKTLILKYILYFLRMCQNFITKTPKFYSEINWPLLVSKPGTILIMQSLQIKKTPKMCYVVLLFKLKLRKIRNWTFLCKFQLEVSQTLLVFRKHFDVEYANFSTLTILMCKLNKIPSKEHIACKT